MTHAEGIEWDYVIVGSGAGGGTLAARLAEAGMRVFLLEAGGDPRTAQGPRLPDDYEVPGFHAFACENDAMSWNFRVRHYANEARQARDPKYDAARQLITGNKVCGGFIAGCTQLYEGVERLFGPLADWTGNEISNAVTDKFEALFIVTVNKFRQLMRCWILTVVFR